MSLVCLGLSHQTAPVDVRERHAFPPSRLGEALVALRDYPAVREAAMLQTCGRLEIYAEVDDFEEGAAQLKKFLSNFGHRAIGYDLESFLYTHLGAAASEHLFRVTTGLDSMLIGEAEILGQVKDAFVQAQSARSLGVSLHRLFRDAMTAGKEARTRTAIGAASASVATAAIELARERLGTLVGKTIAILGAGKMGRTAVRRLKDEGVANIIIVNRTHARAAALLAEIGYGSALDFSDLSEALVAADAIMTSTGASHFVLTRESVAHAMAQRPHRPLFLVDIAVPRDVAPDVVDIPNVTLVDIDGLKSVVDAKLEQRREAIPEVERLIARHVDRFALWYRARAAVPTISSLTQRAEAIRAAEVERIFARLPTLNDHEREVIIGATMTIVSRLLHPAIERVRAKAIADPVQALNDAKVIDELFEFDLVAQLDSIVG